MPDYFSHGIAAEIIYSKLDTKRKSLITNKTLYLLGAQGGDIFFTYNVKPTKSNLGRSLHRHNAIYLFSQLIQGNISYAAGFATHYALDSTLHPDIYAFEETKRSPFTHTKFESDLGLYISRKFGIRRSITPREKLLACTSPVYDTMKRIEPLITVTGVERCLKRYFSYTKYIYLSKKQEYKCEFDFKVLNEKIDEAINLGLQAVKCVLDGDITSEVFNKSFLQRE